MSELTRLNDLPAPEGYVFIEGEGRGPAHLSVEDETSTLPLCGAGVRSPVEFATLPHRLEPCASCLRIAEEASTLPV